MIAIFVDQVSTPKMAPVRNVSDRDPDDLKRAVEAVKSGELSIRKASVKYKIAYETVRTHSNGSRQSTMGRPTVLDNESEAELKDAISEMLRMGHGINMTDLRQLGGEIGAMSDNPGFLNGTPSRCWGRRFVSRHNLAIRAPENISAARLESEKPEIIDQFYKKLEEVYSELVPQGLTPSQIFNTDETGLCMVNKSG